MNRAPILLCLALAACAVAEAEGIDDTMVAQSAAVVEVAEDPHAHVRTDTRGTLRSIDHIRAVVASWDDATQAEARAAASTLMVNCPYNRASFQLPIALEQVASRHHTAKVNDLVREDWRRLQAGLEMHVKVLDAVGGGELLLPIEGDYLTRLEPSTAITRVQLVASHDPIAATQDLLDTVNELVAGYDEETQATISTALATLSQHTGVDWGLNDQLTGWRYHLERMQPNLQDEAMQQDVQAMMDILDAYLFQNSC